MSKFVDLLNFWKKKEDAAPTPTVDEPGRTPWLRVGLLLRAIPFKKLLPAFASVPVIVFLTISGVIAWLAVFLRFAVSIFKFGL